MNFKNTSFLNFLTRSNKNIYLWLKDNSLYSIEKFNNLLPLVVDNCWGLNYYLLGTLIVSEKS